MEARRKSWEQVVALTERREEEVRNGSKGKVDGKWVEDKEEAGERAREAVIAAMKSGDYHDNIKAASSGSSGGGSGAPSDESESKSQHQNKPSPQSQPRPQQGHTWASMRMTNS